MVLIEPEEIWYWQVHPDEVPIVIKQHLQEQCPVKEMLDPKFHK
jgi:(2Fe-2S) ferredoxin